MKKFRINKRAIAVVSAMGLGFSLPGCMVKEKDLSYYSQNTTKTTKFSFDDSLSSDYLDKYSCDGVINASEVMIDDDTVYYLLGDFCDLAQKENNIFEYAKLIRKDIDVTDEEVDKDYNELYNKGEKVILNKYDDDILSNFIYLGTYEYKIPPVDDDVYHYEYVGQKTISDETILLPKYNYVLFKR